MSSQLLTLARPDSPVETIMRAPVATVETATSLQEIAEVLAANEIGAVAVTRHESVIGLVSERDLVAAMARGVAWDTTTAADVMSTELLTIGPKETIATAAERANAALVRHLPVLADRTIVGFVSVRDLLAVLTSAV